MPQYQPIKTRYGILRGREALQLEKLEYDGNTLVLHTLLELNHTSQGTAGAVSGRFEFMNVRVFHITKLEDFRGNLTSSFDEVHGSDWLETTLLEGSHGVRQYQLIMYSDVLEVLCERGSLRLGARPPSDSEIQET
jgi:hypothetical protein